MSIWQHAFDLKILLVLAVALTLIARVVDLLLVKQSLASSHAQPELGRLLPRGLVGFEGTDLAKRAGLDAVDDFFSAHSLLDGVDVLQNLLE